MNNICHYCDQPARLICTQTGDLYCVRDAKINYDNPKDWVVKLTPGALVKYSK